jgi:hypothetical protein
MCDFKPGDEVVCVDASPSFRVAAGRPVKGAVYVVEGYDESRIDGIGLIIAGLGWSHDFDGLTVGWSPLRFRKIERRNDSLSIEAFLTIKPGFEEPRRAPAKKRERV